MNVKDAAFRILVNRKKPVHYKKITERIIFKGLVEFSSSTPERTVCSQLVRDIAKYGKKSRFRQAGKGLYTLSSFARKNPESKKKTKQIKIKPKINKYIPPHTCPK